MTHTCHYPTCKKEVPPRMWGCKQHWFALPKRLRNRLLGDDARRLAQRMAEVDALDVCAAHKRFPCRDCGTKLGCECPYCVELSV